MLCPECDGRDNTFYGSRSTYGTCEICGGSGHINDDGSRPSAAYGCPLWPEHDEDKLERDRAKYGRF